MLLNSFANEGGRRLVIIKEGLTSTKYTLDIQIY